MKTLMLVAAILSFVFAAFSFAAMRSDIQLILAVIGIIGGLLFLAMMSALGKLDRIIDNSADAAEGVEKLLKPTGK